MAGGSTSASVSMKEYLKRYQSGTEDPTKKKNKKKKKAEKPKPSAMGVLVVDEDPVWQKPVQLEEESESDDEVQPQVEEDIEVRRMRRLEAIRAKKPYDAISEDGSGWITVPDTSLERSSDRQTPDLSPPRQRKTRHDSAEPAVLSPPRRNTRHDDSAEVTDMSPPRRKSRRDSAEVTDMSPPRRKNRHDSATDLSPPRRRARHDSPEVSDLSPPRRRKRHDSVETADQSPPRRRSRHNNSVKPADDLSPPRRKRREESGGRDREETDLSPPRKNRNRPSDDLSPPRKANPGPPTKMGLLSAQEIREQNKKTKEQESRILSTEAFIGSKDAEAVFRINGKRVSREDMVKPKEKEKPKEKPLEWGKGLAQKREAEARALELEEEKIKPFARSRDDPELDKMLKETVRWGDPMAHLVKRKYTEPALEDLGDDEKMKESGFIIPQTIPSHSWLKRGLDFPPNRYGIRPGRHWDGVDRSNGFEKEMFKRQNEKRATEREAYLWSVSDM